MRDFIQPWLLVCYDRPARMSAIDLQHPGSSATQWVAIRPTSVPDALFSKKARFEHIHKFFWHRVSMTFVRRSLVRNPGASVLTTETMIFGASLPAIMLVIFNKREKTSADLGRSRR